MTFLCLTMFNAHAVDLNKYKEKLRSHMQNMLGTNTTNKLLGVPPKKKEYSVDMPAIPAFESNSTDLGSLNKNIAINFQGEDFNKLSVEQKRPYRISFIKELYQVTIQTEAKDEDVLNALNALEQGGDREGVYRGVVLGRVYGSMETFVQAPSDNLIDFVNFYAEKFLNKAFDNEAMKKLSFYSIKRVIVEKTLELLDVLAPEANDIHAWYAIFSADLARKYPDNWSNKVRSKKSDSYHYEWAKKVPFQQIKSEVIIKLHMVMNSMDNPIGKTDS
jgi:hypothetical protein